VDAQYRSQVHILIEVGRRQHQRKSEKKNAHEMRHHLRLPEAARTARSVILSNRAATAMRQADSVATTLCFAIMPSSLLASDLQARTPEVRLPRLTIVTGMLHFVALQAVTSTRAVKHIVDWFCNGSLDEVLVGMADARMLDSRTLQRVAWRIDEAKAKRGQ
jgi:hypothetical protein